MAKKTPTKSESVLDMISSKITITGGAILILFGVGGGTFEVGRNFKENEKNLEIFDMKIGFVKSKDSMKNLCDSLRNTNNELKLKLNNTSKKNEKK